MSLATEIHTLQAAGAKTILVRGAQGTGTLSAFWTTTLFSDLSGLHVKFIDVDMAQLVQTVEANPTAYGFTAATVFPGVPGSTTGSACVAGLGASGWGQWCADTTIPSPDYSHLRAANSGQTSFFSDDQHFSAAGQAVVANYEFHLIQSNINTPLPASLPLFASALAGLIVFHLRGRRASAALRTA
ncbi:MAG TPA: hypothetical protein VKW08_18450 [Xanthobacteraceae bacterium]|nr:hypothetical protein [Xanthobacteraceae bacterium]